MGENVESFPDTAEMRIRLEYKNVEEWSTEKVTRLGWLVCLSMSAPCL